jgi:hypothetical protein
MSCSKCVLSSSLIFLFIASLATSDPHSQLRLVTKTAGVLGAGNFSHFSLNDRGTFKLVLVSSEGDADLYVSDKHSRVDFSNYDYQSTTYGDDSIFIKEDMTRPVYISVYAHPYYYQATFTLYQYEIDTKHTPFINELDILSDNAYFDHVNDEFTRIDSEKNANEQTYMEHYNYHNGIDRDHFKENNKASQSSNQADTRRNSEKRAASNDHDGDESQDGFIFKLLIHLLEFIAEILL